MFGSGVARDRAAGIPVTNEVYRPGDAGISEQSLPLMCRKIREGMATAVMKSFAGNVLKEYGFPDGVQARTSALLDFVRKNVAYAPDALGTEQIQSGAITLCVKGAPVCIPVGDCDDLVTALGTLVAALGMECQVVRQIFGGGAQEHVLLEVKDERGKWLAADPSSKTMPVGRKAPAQKETYCSPWDSDVTGLPDVAQFVGIGSLPTNALPVLMMSHGAWHQVDHLPQRVGVGAQVDAVLREIAPGIEVDMRSGEVQVVGLGDACCANCASGKTCEGESKEPQSIGLDAQAGLAGLIDDTANALKLSPDPVYAAKALWAAAQGKSWDGAIGAADSRAESMNWSTELGAQMDLATLALSSAFSVRALTKRGDPESVRISDTLTRSFYILLKRIGRAPTNASTVSQYTGGLTAAAEVPIGIIVALAITAAVIYVAFFAFIYYILRDCLSLAATTFVCDREMMRLHSEVDKIAANHADGGSYTPQELQRVADLEAAQRRVLEGCIEAVKPPGGSSPFPWNTVAIIVGIGGLTALGLMYAPEIKRALAPHER